MSSLVETIREIEQWSLSTSDKATRIFNSFSEYAQHSDLVSRVIRREITFALEYEALFGQRDGLGVLYPHLPFDDQTNKRVTDAYRVFGLGYGKSHHPHTLANLFNPISFFGCFFGLSYLAKIGETIAGGSSNREPRKDVDFTRRDFLITTPLFSLIAGLLTGIIPSFVINNRFNVLRQNAEYLDRIHTLYFVDRTYTPTAD